MAAPTLPLPRPDLQLLDSNGKLTTEAYGLLTQIVREIKRIEAGLTAAAIPF